MKRIERDDTAIVACTRRALPGAVNMLSPGDGCCVTWRVRGLGSADCRAARARTSIGAAAKGRRPRLTRSGSGWSGGHRAPRRRQPDPHRATNRSARNKMRSRRSSGAPPIASSGIGFMTPVEVSSCVRTAFVSPTPPSRSLTCPARPPSPFGETTRSMFRRRPRDLRDRSPNAPTQTARRWFAGRELLPIPPEDLARGTRRGSRCRCSSRSTLHPS